MKLKFLKAPSGDEYAMGQNGRIYRFHYLSGLKVSKPGHPYPLGLLGPSEPRYAEPGFVESIAQAYEDDCAKAETVKK